MNHALLTADAFLALLAVVMNSVFAALILFRTAKTIVYRTFFLICTATIIWNLGDFMVYVTARQGWFYFSLIGTAMLPALMFHFISALVKPQQERHPLLIPFYLYSGFLALSSPLAMVNTEIRRFVDGFVWNVCYLALFIPVFLCIPSLNKSIQREAEIHDYFRKIILMGLDRFHFLNSATISERIRLSPFTFIVHSVVLIAVVVSPGKSDSTSSLVK